MMKKYIQYNAAQYASTPVEVGSRPNSVNSERQKDDCSGLVLDLSGKHGIAGVPTATRQKWNGEQDSALDLSNAGLHMGGNSQAEALDLSKPSFTRTDAISRLPFPTSKAMHQSGPTMSQAPPTSNVIRPMTGQYSLLQAALNSTQPSTVVQPSFTDTASLDSRARMIAALAAFEASRGIKPFTSVGPRPFGMQMPPLSFPNNPPVTIIQGVHKPIAITAPQPHVSQAVSKSQTSSHTTMSVSNSRQQLGDNNGSRKFQYTSGNHKQGPVSDKLLLQESYQRDMERYVLQTQKPSKQLINKQTSNQLDAMDGFKCLQCGKFYKTKAALKLHATVHKTSEERQYECPMCKRRFLHRHHLVVHQRKHSGEKPYKCDACDKSFMAIFLLHKHLRKHVRETGPNCQISSDQLVQLSVKKDTVDVSGVDKISVFHPKVIKDTVRSSAKKKLVIFDEERVLPLNDAEKLSKLHELTNLELLKNKEMFEDLKAKKLGIEVIDLSSDEYSSSYGSGNAKDLPSSKSDSSIIVEKKSKSQGTCQKGKNQGQDIYSRDDKDTSKRYPDIHQNDALNIDVKSSDSTPEKILTSESIEENDDIVNPFPVYTSGDEVELDFETGELKVVSKVTVASGNKDVDCRNTDRVACDGIKNSDKNTNHVDKDIILSNGVKECGNISDALSFSEKCAGEKQGEIMDKECVKDALKGSVNLSSVQSNHINHDNIATVQTDPIQESENEQNDSLVVKSVKSLEESQNSFSRSDRNIFEDVGNNLNLNQQDSLRKQDIEMEKNLYQSQTETQHVLNSMISEVENSINDIETDSSKNHPIHNCQVERKTKTKKKCRRKVRREKCEVCSRTFHSNHHLILHMAVHKKNQMLQSLKKAKAQQMKSMGYQQQKINVVCHICKKLFKFQKSLNSHMRVHSEKMAKHKILSKAFRDFMLEAVPSSKISEKTSSKSLSVLECIDSPLKHDANKATVGDAPANSYDESRVDCIEYLDRYSKNYRLDDPPIKVIIGKDNIKRYLCHACDNTYTTKQKLRMHALIHKDNCFLCDICGKSFFRLLTLEKHILTHKLPRPHVCSICKKSFIHRSSLMRHRVMHDKPNAPSIKQQVEDISFELKMLDTYTMLRQERLQKMQSSNLNKVNGDSINSMQGAEIKSDTQLKSDILDLTVRIRTDDVSLPPVLSPANTPNNIQQNPFHLSPPVITGESCHSDQGDKQEPDNILSVKQEPMEFTVKDESTVGSPQAKNKSFESGKKRTSDEMNEPNVTPDTFHKKSRKTRVYQTSCRVCKEKFPNVMTLKSHMSVHNMVETHLYECNVCHHRFTQSCSLLRHLKTSCQENRLKCLPCGKTFHQKHSYEQHMKLHNGIPPNLDGSFYDKRKDEVEGIQVKEERESDIENNNNTKSIIVSQNAVKEEPMCQETLKSDVIPLKLGSVKTEVTPCCQSVQMNTCVKPGSSGLAITNYDSDDSDAKTFLYSEGRGRIRDLADFSDSEDIPAKFDTKQLAPIRPQSVESGSSSGIMTLNLLSAVCSDIRNAEKEEETRRREIEERQKELETIEILANLKRGRMQRNPSVSSNSSQEVQSSAILNEKLVSSSFESQNTTQSIVPSQIATSGHSGRSFNCELKDHEVSSKVLDMNLLSTNKIEAKNILNIPQIPTVVFEIAAEAERLRQERLAKMCHGDGKNNTTGSFKEDFKAGEINSQAHFLQSLSQMTLHDRLSLLMKAQFPQSPITAPVSTHQTLQYPLPPPSAYSNISSAPVTTYTLTRPQSVPTVSSCQQPPSKTNVKIPPQVMPQDLSMKKHSISISSSSRSPLASSSLSSPSTVSSVGTRPSKVAETGSCVPPLVNVFHCELCGKCIYNQIEFQLHLQEHLHAFQMQGHSLMAHHGSPGQRSWILDRAQNLATSSSHNHQRENMTKIIPHTESSTPPSTLDLTLKKVVAPDGMSQEVLSSMASSDFSSDTIPSPSTTSSTSAAMNLDVLRKELRNKIYARRKSQGLEDLTVEFKAPEPTEMSEEERLKLDYRRECNRQAAQRSRMRKKDLVDSLIEELQEEEIVNSDLRQKLESLSAEKNSLLKALESHTCVREKAQISAVDDTTDAKKHGLKEKLGERGLLRKPEKSEKC